MPRAKPFPVRVRQATTIPRWSLIPTLQRDNVASHSWFVTFYASQIADLIEWSGPRADLLTYAVLHDIEEVITGDFVAPVKEAVLNKDKLEQYVHSKMVDLMPSVAKALDDLTERCGPVHMAQIRAIVRVADRLDALFFALSETLMGNAIIAARVPSCEEKLEEMWFKLPVHDAEWLRLLWLDEIVPAIRDHAKAYKYDIDKTGYRGQSHGLVAAARRTR